MSITILNRVLTLTQSVPQLDRAVSGSRDDLAIIEGESDGENIFGVADEAASSDAGGEVPEAELGVPAAGESELAVGREDDVFDEVRVTGETAAREAVDSVFLGEVPDYEGFVARGCDDHVGVVDWGCDCGHPVCVGFHCSSQN